MLVGQLPLLSGALELCLPATLPPWLKLVPGPTATCGERVSRMGVGGPALLVWWDGEGLAHWALEFIPEPFVGLCALHTHNTCHGSQRDHSGPWSPWKFLENLV